MQSDACGPWSCGAVAERKPGPAFQMPATASVDCSTACLLSTGVSKRDVVVRMTRMYLTAEQAKGYGLPAKRTFVDASYSDTHPDAPEVKGYVRIQVFTAGYIAQEEGPNKTSIINVGSANPGGWIPTKVRPLPYPFLVSTVRQHASTASWGGGGAVPPAPPPSRPPTRPPWGAALFRPTAGPTTILPLLYASATVS